ncbi:hypothetical protein ACVUMT_003464 [Vibrio cholerae]
MNTTNRFFEKTGALIVVILLFALSARLEYEFWLAGSKYTNFLSPEHVAWAIAIASNVAKFLVWGRCVMFKNNNQRIPVKFSVGAAVLVLHSMLCGVFAVAHNFDRAGMSHLKQERVALANTEYNLMTEQQIAIAAQQRQVIVDNHQRAREAVIAEYVEPIAKWDAVLAKEENRTFRGTTDHMGRDYKFALEQKSLEETERSTRLAALDEQHKADLIAHSSTFEARMASLAKDFTSQLAATSSERLLEENPIGLTDPMFAPFLRVLKDTLLTETKPAWIILAASVLLNTIFELITVLMLAILLCPVRVDVPQQPVAA